MQTNLYKDILELSKDEQYAFIADFLYSRDKKTLKSIFEKMTDDDLMKIIKSIIAIMCERWIVE
jgi:hypothetical protein